MLVFQLNPVCFNQPWCFNSTPFVRLTNTRPPPNNFVSRSVPRHSGRWAPSHEWDHVSHVTNGGVFCIQVVYLGGFNEGPAKHQVEMMIYFGTRCETGWIPFHTLNLWHVSKSPFGFLEYLSCDASDKDIFKSWLPWHMIQSLEFWQEIQGKLVQKKKKHGINISGYFTSHPQYFSVSICLTTKHSESFTSWGLCCWVRFQPSIIKYTAGILSVPTSHHDLGEIWK